MTTHPACPLLTMNFDHNRPAGLLDLGMGETASAVVFTSLSGGAFWEVAHGRLPHSAWKLMRDRGWELGNSGLSTRWEVITRFDSLTEMHMFALDFADAKREAAAKRRKRTPRTPRLR